MMINEEGLKGKPNRAATNDVLYTPVPGSGIELTKKSPHKPYFSVFSLSISLIFLIVLTMCNTLIAVYIPTEKNLLNHNNNKQSLKQRSGKLQRQYCHNWRNIYQKAYKYRNQQPH